MFGIWNFDPTDDLTNPQGYPVPITSVNHSATIHTDFAMHWMLEDKESKLLGAALFHREFGRTASYYANRTFEPEYRKFAQDILPANRSYDIDRAKELCDDSYQCQYDYVMTLNRDQAHFTRNYYDTITQIRALNKRESKFVAIITIQLLRFINLTNTLKNFVCRIFYVCDINDICMRVL